MYSFHICMRVMIYLKKKKDQNKRYTGQGSFQVIIKSLRIIIIFFFF